MSKLRKNVKWGDHYAPPPIMRPHNSLILIPTGDPLVEQGLFHKGFVSISCYCKSKEKSTHCFFANFECQQFLAGGGVAILPPSPTSGRVNGEGGL